MLHYKSTIIALLFPLLLQAQSTTHYRCDFESQTESATWTMDAGRAGASCENHWAIGTPGRLGMSGSQGLYLYSGSDKSRAWYQASRNTAVLATRALTLTAGSYRLSADWIVGGAENDALYILWVPASESGALSDPNPLQSPMWLEKYLYIRGRNAKRWQSSYVDFTVEPGDEAGKLVVLFYSETGTPVLPAPQVDNIQVVPLSEACPAINNLKFVGHNGQFEWQSGADEIEIIVVNGTDTTRHSVHAEGQLSSDFITEETVYDVYARSLCGEYSSCWTILRDVFVWQKGKRCIDFLDLTKDNSGVGKCYSGGWGLDDRSNVIENLRENAGQVDEGCDSPASLHTIHYRRGEMDERTQNMLPTVPDDEVASVRLNGLWSRTHNSAASVEYDYHVEDGSNDLLVLKYAAVLEHVGDEQHKEENQPRFRLEILRRNPDNTIEPIDDGCSQADMRAGFGETSDWHVNPQYTAEDGKTHASIHWCDWQTVTVSLRDYVGLDIVIRLTAYSCTFNEHFGYAYFTLACRDGSLPTRSCEEGAVNQFTAPAGFDYRWYRQSDEHKPLSQREILGRDSLFDIPADGSGSVYLVDVINRYKPSCYYTLLANPNPFGPLVQVTPTSKVEDCENVVSFSNRSGVFYTPEGVAPVPHETDTLDYLSWDFGDGETLADCRDRFVTHTYPKEGGTFTVRLLASMAEGVCVSEETTLTITLPDLTRGEQEIIETCAASYTDSQGVEHLREDGDFVDIRMGENEYGCPIELRDSIVFRTAYDTLYDIHICDGETYTWPANGRTYRNIEPPVKDEPIIRYDTVFATTTLGCDSLICLQLTIDAKLTVRIPDTLGICMDDPVINIPLEVITGHTEYVTITFPEQEQSLGFEPEYTFAIDEDIVIPIPENLRVDFYHPTFTFDNELCSDPVSAVLEMQYPSSIVMQRYGFMAVPDSTLNGGYIFRSYEWYSESDALLGNDFYLPTAAVNDFGSYYYVRLTREGETQSFRSCPVYYNPTQAVENLPLLPEMPCTIYTAMGTVYDYQTRELRLPTEPGLYIIRFANYHISRVFVY